MWVLITVKVGSVKEQKTSIPPLLNRFLKRHDVHPHRGLYGHGLSSTLPQKITDDLDNFLLMNGSCCPNYKIIMYQLASV